MKIKEKLKHLFIISSLICIGLYLFFLFVLPKCVDLNKFSNIVEDNFYKKTGYNIRLYNPTVSTSPNLCLTAGIKKADIFFNNKKFAQVNDLKINISLLPILLKKVKITNVNASKIIVELPENITIPKKQHSKIAFLEKFPDVNIDYVRFSIRNGNDLYSLKGHNFIFYDNPVLDKMKLSVNGEVLVNKKKNVIYDLDLFFKIPDGEQKNLTENLSEILNTLEEYKINSKLVIKADLSDLKNIKGNIDISDFSFICNQKKFLNNYAFLDFDKDKIRIKSNIYTSSNKKIDVSGIFSYGKNKNIDLKFKGEKIEVKDILTIAKAISGSLGYDKLKGLYANGVIDADFKVKSNFKTLNSTGQVKAQNINIAYKGYNIDNINSNIDFSDNKIKINEARAYIMNTPIDIKGSINSDAYADISIKTENINLDNFTNQNFKKENLIKGNALFNAYIQGNLKDISPEANLKISDFYIKNKKTGVVIKNAETIGMLKDKNFSLNSYNILLLSPDGFNSMLIPKISIALNKDFIIIPKVNFWIDNVKAELSGKILSPLDKPRFENTKIFIPNQKNLSGPKNSRISVSGELSLSGDIKKPTIKGNINIPKLTIPSDSINITNASVVADNGFRINLPYVYINSSVARVNAYISDILSNEIRILNLNFDTLYLDKLKTVSKKYIFVPNIISGTLKANKFKTFDINAENVSSNLSVKNNELKLSKLMADAYTGKISANILYDIKNDNTSMILQGRDVNSFDLLKAVSGQEQDISGKCDFDSKITFSGSSKTQIQKSTLGDVRFIIKNFKSNNLGKLDYLIQAQNILSDSVLKPSLNVVKNALKIKDIGLYSTAKGDIHIEKEIVYIKDIKLAGPSMSLYMKGHYHINNYDALILILGKVSNEIVSALGPIGKLEKSENHTYKLGSLASAFVSDVTTEADLNDVSKVPDLTIKTDFKTKAFKVLISGPINKQTSVKSFKWINDDNIRINNKIINYNKRKKDDSNLPDFIKNLPDFKQ